MPDPIDLRSPAARAHVRLALGLVALGAALFAVNLALLAGGIATGATRSFPISVVTPHVPTAAGLVWAAAFLGLVALAMRVRWTSGLAAWALGLALILSGNGIQGSAEAAFATPLAGDDQYLDDARDVEPWTEWLASFNDRQPGLSTHARTHPPFAVLVHAAGLRLTGGTVLLLGLAFALVASLSIPVVFALAGALGADREQAALVALLFAALPAVNVYAAVSLDGLILAASVPFLLGVVRTVRSGRFSWADAGLAALGLVLTNLLTYGGVFLMAAGGLVALAEGVRQRRWAVARTLAVAVAALAAVVALLQFAGYDHVQGFLTASRLENPDRFRGVSEPLAYVVTRVEGVAEVALFVSLGVLTRLVWLARRRRTDAAAWLVAGAGVVALLAMLAAGAYRTGETARAALFLYPYLVLPLATSRPAVLRLLIGVAGLQTAAMQVAGSYFW